VLRAGSGWVTTVCCAETKADACSVVSVLSAAVFCGCVPCIGGSKLLLQSVQVDVSSKFDGGACCFAYEFFNHFTD
jgi:hypothetical protein